MKSEFLVRKISEVVNFLEIIKGKLSGNEQQRIEGEAINTKRKTKKLRGKDRVQREIGEDLPRDISAI